MEGGKVNSMFPYSLSWAYPPVRLLLALLGVQAGILPQDRDLLERLLQRAIEKQKNNC